jgi:hypothetical protein
LGASASGLLLIVPAMAANTAAAAGLPGRAMAVNRQLRRFATIDQFRARHGQILSFRSILLNAVHLEVASNLFDEILKGISGVASQHSLSLG